MTTEKTREKPIRMCVICRERFPKSQLIRHVAVWTAPAGEDSPAPRLVEDPAQTSPGRGFYACRRTECLERLPKHRGWMKKVKGGVNGR